MALTYCTMFLIFCCMYNYKRKQLENNNRPESKYQEKETNCLTFFSCLLEPRQPYQRTTRLWYKPCNHWPRLSWGTCWPESPSGCWVYLWVASWLWTCFLYVLGCFSWGSHHRWTPRAKSYPWTSCRSGVVCGHTPGTPPEAQRQGRHSSFQWTLTCW